MTSVRFNGFHQVKVTTESGTPGSKLSSLERAAFLRQLQGNFRSLRSPFEPQVKFLSKRKTAEDGFEFSVNTGPFPDDWDDRIKKKLNGVTQRFAWKVDQCDDGLSGKIVLNKHHQSCFQSYTSHPKTVGVTTSLVFV